MNQKTARFKPLNFFILLSLPSSVIFELTEMKVRLHFLFAITASVAGVAAQVSPLQPYPDSNKVPVIGFNYGDSIPIECIQRNTDTGEHKFDDTGAIVYAPFPNCFETDAPLALRYNVDEVVNCTVDLGHDFFHVFQLLIHEDVPFSCRIPCAKQSADGKTKPSFIPLTFNVRGDIQESHLHVDPFMNVALMANNTGNTLVGGAAFSTGSSSRRVIIGDMLPFTLSIRWYKGSVMPTARSALISSSTTLMYCFGTFIGTLALTSAVFYGLIFPTKLKREIKLHIPGSASYDKLD